MIELIFAIVIVSIAVISLPTMIQVTSKGIESNIVQEAIFAASAELMGATSYYWDAKSMEDNETSHLSKVINIDNDCEDNASSPRYRRRPGHITQLYHRKCLNNLDTDPDDNPNSNFPNLNNTETTGDEDIFDIGATAEATGYKNIYTKNVVVTRTDNIKKITITIKNSDGDTITSLNTYGANIGEIDYYKRRF